MYAESVPQANMMPLDTTASRGESNALVSTSLLDDEPEGVDQHPDALPAPGAKWQLKKLSPKHRDICALIAQGVGRAQIANLCKITPEYVTMLTRQPLCVQYIKELNEFAGLQLEAMFVKTVEAIGEGLGSSVTKDRLQAARLQLEVTGRVGSKGQRPNEDNGMEDRLLNLSERLVGLLANAKTIAGHQTIEDAEFTEITGSDD